MKTEIIQAVKNYSKVMIAKDIEVVDPFQFESCKTSSIIIKLIQKKIKFVVNVESKSLEKIALHLFSKVEDEMLLDLQKELANTIGGYFANRFYKIGYELSIPYIEKVCDTKYGIFFQNDVLKLCIKLRSV